MLRQPPIRWTCCVAFLSVAVLAPRAWAEKSRFVTPAEVGKVVETADLLSTEATGDEELIVERYPSRSVKIKRQVIQDADHNYINHGKWTMWDIHGKKLSEGQFKNGKRHGNWVRWYTGDSVKGINVPFDKNFKEPFRSYATFVHGELNGMWAIVDAKGRKMCSWHFKRGKLHGKSVLWHPNDVKKYEVHYNDGMLDGDISKWKANGKLTKKRSIHAGREYKRHIEKYPSGKLRVVGGHLTGQQILKTHVDWWNGSLQSEMVNTIGEDKKHGVWVYRFPDGEKQLEIEFEDSVSVGSLAAWHSNGQKAVAGVYENGNQIGKWTWWYSNGQKQVEGEFSHGQQTGNWFHWEEDGKISLTQLYTLQGTLQAENSKGNNSLWTATDDLMEFPRLPPTGPPTAK